MPFLGAETALAFVGAFPSIGSDGQDGWDFLKETSGRDMRGVTGLRRPLMIRATCSSSRAGDDTCGQR
jgi:hypothetical protein